MSPERLRRTRLVKVSEVKKWEVDEQSSNTLSPPGDFKPGAPIVGVPMLWRHNRPGGLLPAVAWLIVKKRRRRRFTAVQDGTVSATVSRVLTIDEETTIDNAIDFVADLYDLSIDKVKRAMDGEEYWCIWNRIRKELAFRLSVICRRISNGKFNARKFKKVGTDFTLSW